MAIRLIRSGAQTGADQGGLEAALSLGIPTGGFCPNHCRTEDGNRPDLVVKYGLTQTGSSGYPQRTELNVKHSDGTVIFGDDNSAGSQLTRRLCKNYNKPVLCNPIRETFLLWLERYNISDLNVAGNRESVNPGIQASTRAFLIDALGGRNGN